ncbi:MAG TPA: MOSC N-terminal beta barrel domain-containing protein [Azospirillaceae bacterium]|nr:MOSC N-terminal beta barrel domain-containing protein [Azospirillaceae bacterium]
MSPQVARIFRFPVKGLGAQELDAVDLVAARCLPLDRRFAIRRGGGWAEPSGEWQPRGTFITPERHPRLAALETEFNPATLTLVIRRGGRPVVQGRLDTPMGRTVIEQFLAAYLKEAALGVPRIVEATGMAFLDQPEPTVSIINAASLADVERALRMTVSPWRWRANLMIENLPSWAEEGWIGRPLLLGEATLIVTAPTAVSAMADMMPPGQGNGVTLSHAYRRAFTRATFGVLARVAVGGRVAVGDAVSLT